MEINGSVCRTCLTRDEENIPLSSLVVPWKNKVEGKEMLEFLLGCTEIDDSEPFSEICNSCINILMISYSFKLKCLASEEQIREYRKPLDVAFSFLLPNKEDLDASEDEYLPDFDAQSLPDEEELIESKNIQMEQIKQQNKLTAAHIPRTPKQNKDNSQNKGKICDICGKICVRLDNHKKYVHGEKRFLCALCDYSGTSKCSIRSHMVIHIKQKTLSCKYCNERFLRHGVRINHIKMKHETHIDHKKFQCNLCLKKFFRNTDLRRHMKSHTKERPYECKTCNLKFANKFTFNQHSKDENITCTICGETLPSKICYKNHLKMSHPKENKYFCDVCKEGFGTEFAMKFHRTSAHPYHPRKKPI